MNDDASLADRPFGDETDEAVSAVVDDQLGAFAADHGMTEEAARARLVAWPGFAARRRELERVRAGVATALPLDDTTRRRLAVTAARADAEPRRRASRARALLIAGAAGLVVVALVGYALARDPGERSTASSSKAGSGAGALDRLAARNGNPFVGDLGDVTEPTRLRGALASRGVFRSDGTSRAPAAASDQGDGATGGTQRAQLAPGNGAAARACADRLVGGGPAAGKTVVLLGDATVAQRPVVVVAVVDRGRVVAFVVARDTCAVLSAQSI